jgi:hypothetical protein
MAREYFMGNAVATKVIPKLCGFAKVMRAYLREKTLDLCGCTLNREKSFKPSNPT